MKRTSEEVLKILLIPLLNNPQTKQELFEITRVAENPDQSNEAAGCFHVARENQPRAIGLGLFRFLIYDDAHGVPWSVPGSG